VNCTSSQDSKLPALSGPGTVAACKSRVKVKFMVDDATFQPRWHGNGAVWDLLSPQLRSCVINSAWMRRASQQG